MVQGRKVCVVLVKRPRKLTDEQVRDILRRLRTGKGKRRSPDSELSLSRFYNIPQSTISRIANRKLYRHVKV